MFDAQFPMRKQRFAAGAASMLLHGALAIVLFTMTVPAVRRAEPRFGYASLLFTPKAAAKTQTKSRPFRSIVAPKLVLPKPSVSTPLPHSTGAEPEAPEISPAAALSAPIALLSLSLPPMSTEPLPTASPRRPEIRTGGFESPAQSLPRVSHAAHSPPESRLSEFDSSVARPDRNSRGAIAEGVFHSVEGAAAPAQHREIAPTQFAAVDPRPAARGDAATANRGMRLPIEIAFKPRPLYTEEARRLRIEGEVTLLVAFRASSEVCVLRVVRGLGHGLDENAIAAAAAIRFRPATLGGRPIDDIATVRITFQLAE